MTDLIKRDDALLAVNKVFNWYPNQPAVAIRALPAVTVGVKQNLQVKSDAVNFLYKHGDFTYTEAAEALDKLTGNGFVITRSINTIADSPPAIAPAAIREAALTAKLTKAVEALRIISQFNAVTNSHLNVYNIFKMTDHARAVLAELEEKK